MAQVTVIAVIQSNPGHEDELEAALKGLIEPSLADEGCINYDMHRSTEPGVFMFYENWESQDALDAHLRTPHLLAFLEEADRLVDGDIELSLWAPI